MKKTGKNVRCNYCGELVYKKRRDLLRYKTFYCNDDCYTKGGRTGRVPWNKNTKGVMKANRTSFKKGEHRSLETEFKKGQVSINKGKKFSDEYRKKLSRAHMGIQSGEKHPNWKGGLSKQKYPREFNQLLKDKVLRRDSVIGWDGVCQKCGRIQEHCGQLTIHHIDYNKYNNSLDNLISLCRSCNIKVNKNRDYWRNYFKERVKRNYFYFCNT